MAEAQNTEAKTYRGNCHCGAFVYEIDVPEIKSVGECNCSICHRKAYLWVFTANDQFRVVKGSIDELTGYTFGGKKMEHLFCPNCATAVMARALDPSFPKEMQVGINARGIQNLGVNSWELEKTPFDGKSMWGSYEAPTYNGELPSAEVEGGKLYTGSCHCGKVTIALKSKPLDETFSDRFVECNCSICERGGYFWVYPKKEQVVLTGAEEEIGGYAFNNGILDKTFCKTCGVHMTNRPKKLSQTEMDALSEGAKAWSERAQAGHPVNLRMLEGVDLSKLKSQKSLGADYPQKYVNP